MGSNDSKIKVDITGDVTGLRKSINIATGQITRFGQDVKKSLTTFGGQGFDGLKTGFLAIGAAATASAAAGIYAFTSAMSASIAKASEFSSAAFAVESSLGAANRQFSVGTAAQWEQSIKDLGKTLRVYSETDLRNAASKTIDMTKRLGMSAEQMKKVIQISGDLGAGKTSLVDAVERVTGALRGEAEASELLGLTLNEDYVKALYEASGATSKAWKDLTDLEKAQFRYKILLDQATPGLGKAANSVNIYSGALADLTNNFGKMETEAGSLVTNNTFVIESFKILSATFKGLAGDIVANREQLIGLVKNGFLLLVDSIGGAIEVIRFFHNGWQGLSLAAHGATTLIIKGMGLTVTAIRGALMPLDLLLSGLAKAGAIDSNPLKDWEKTMKGVGDVSVEEFDKLLGKVTSTNQTFDQAKKFVEEYRKKIAEIPAQYKSTAEQMKGETEKVAQEIRRLADGSFTNIPEKAAAASKVSTASIKQDAKEVEAAWRQTDNGTYTNIPDKAAAASKASAASIKQDAKEVEAAWRTLPDGTFTNTTDEQRQSFKIMADGMKQDIDSVGEANTKVVEQVRANLAYLEAEAAKGDLSEEMIGKIEALKERLVEISAESTKSQKMDIEEVTKATRLIGNGLMISFAEGEKSSDAATRTMLANIDKIKRAAASIKFPAASSSSVDGYAKGGNPFFGGLRGYGGGDRRLIMVEDGEHVIRKEAVAAFGHGYFQKHNNLNFLRSLPRFATGGQIGVAAPAMPMAGGDTYMTFNYSGPASRQSAKEMADIVMADLQRRFRGRS